MIGRAYLCGVSEKENERVDHHLWKTLGQTPQLWSVRNLAVRSSQEGFAVMRALVAASQATKAFMHVIMSPRARLSADQRETRVAAICAEFDCADNPMLAFAHTDKIRARPGGADEHYHLIVGYVGPDLKAIDAREYAARIEKVARVLEADFEGVPTLGYWHRAVVAALRREGRRPDVAASLVAAFGECPPTPKARMTDGMRRAALRANFDLPSFQASVDAAWRQGWPAERMRAYLSAEDVEMIWGERCRVILFRSATGLFLGALHRILQRPVDEIYEEVRARYEQIITGTPSHTGSSDFAAGDRRADRSGTIGGGRSRDPGHSGGGGRRGPDRDLLKDARSAEGTEAGAGQIGGTPPSHRSRLGAKMMRLLRVATASPTFQDEWNALFAASEHNVARSNMARQLATRQSEVHRIVLWRRYMGGSAPPDVPAPLVEASSAELEQLDDTLGRALGLLAEDEHWAQASLRDLLEAARSGEPAQIPSF